MSDRPSGTGGRRTGLGRGLGALIPQSTGGAGLLEVDVDRIIPNPWQPRQGEDPAVVAELAASIKKNGLMQIPSARRVNGHYQLAFGHTRLAAFKLNGETSMPLFERELTDLQMFEMGVSENIKRRDLNPIEEAEAMRRYMADFDKNSVETAEFFNCSPEKVRSTVRLSRDSSCRGNTACGPGSWAEAPDRSVPPPRLRARDR